MTVNRVTQVGAQTVGAEFEGRMDRSLLNNPDFNVTTVESALLPSVLALRQRGQPVIFVDAGCGPCGMSLELAVALQERGIHDVYQFAVDVIYGEVARGRTTAHLMRQNGRLAFPITFIQGRIVELPIDLRRLPSIIAQRAVAHYYVPGRYRADKPITHPQGGYTREQFELYRYYLKRSKMGDRFIEIISSSLERQFCRVGLDRLQFILSKIAGGKQLHYLKSDDVRAMASIAHVDGKRFQIVDEGIIPGKHGYRDIEELWRRYGASSGISQQNFRNWVITLYLEALELYPGETNMMYAVDENDKVTFNPAQIVNIWIEMEYPFFVMEVVETG